VCVCVSERERESVCVCVCVCVEGSVQHPVWDTVVEDKYLSPPRIETPLPGCTVNSLSVTGRPTDKK
jgi:hypothetical protein